MFGLAVILGALIWLLSPLFTGQREAWDAQSPYYDCALLLAGFLPACLSARRFWLWAVAAWLGQLAAFAFLVLHTVPVGADLWPVGLVFLTLYSLLSLAGAALGASVHVTLHRLFLRGTKVP